jgi:CubicO group peptidase (beta-lactamase class C family)
MRQIFFVALLLFCNRPLFGQITKRPQLQSSKQKTINERNFFLKLGQEANDSIPSLGSFLVWRKNMPVYEGYFHGAAPQSVFNIKSVAKTMISAIAGIARDKGLLPDLNTPVLSILTEYAKPVRSSSNVWFSADKAINDSIRATLTLRHLLTMTGGFDWNDFGPTAVAMVASSDPVRFTLDIPFNEYPGDTFNYNTGVSIIFGAALAKSITTDLRSFADSNLFQQAGIKLIRWDLDPMGRYLGGSEMYMTAADLMRFGLLFLNHGKTGNRQVISSSWIKESTAAQTKLDSWPVMPGANGYGYYWWRRKTNGHQAYVASGFGGQLICIIPDKDMVIVTTCFLNEKNRGREEIRRLHSFIDKVVKASK